MSTRKKITPEPTVVSPTIPTRSTTDGPLVFISHDSRDAELAGAFSDLLRDASGGVLKSFRSSDRTGTTGIPYGAEWYPAIIDRLGAATDVVALLTPRSVGRPWILYEAGIAKGKLAANAQVFGIAFGMTLGDATVGPFAQFQNSEGDEGAITAVVLQLIRRNPQADPSEQAVRRQVQAFLESVAKLPKENATKLTHPPTTVDENTVAKFFEEIKVLVSGVPDRVADGLGLDPRMQRMRKPRRFHPMMFESLLHHSMAFEKSGNSALPLLMAFSLLRDDIPWMYEMGAQLYRAIEKGDIRAIERIQKSMIQANELMLHGPMREMLGDLDWKDVGFILHQVNRFAERAIDERRRSSSRSLLLKSAVLDKNKS